ncbi:hypothetical protein KII95_01725 [Leuconostoc gelidum subsp. aenigmaticum]|uniref:hypothetical protein n=1 Tax=Leuconostoc gasicomitatum TaxID=115778 RepID=UPI0039AF9D00|nr:hypothetical protein [Leuconostoc gelidum subsp. aenigmaticum]
MTQSDKARSLGYTLPLILRELPHGNSLYFSYLDKRTRLNMNIHARIRYSYKVVKYIALKKWIRMAKGVI